MEPAPILEQLIDRDGRAVADLPDHDDSWLLSLLEHMLRMRCIEERMMLLQRTGRLPFVGPATGMEGAVIGTAAALEERDWLWSGLREGGAALMWGLPLAEYVGHMLGNANDTAKGRQMSSHFQHRASRFPSWSSVIGTQIPHGVGAAFAAKRHELDEVHAIHFGDGATSSSGFHSGLNFAGVWNVPAVFVCMDNGWAISVPASRQTAARSFASKVEAYGMPGFEVDGNDVLACHAAMRTLVERAREGHGPALLVPRTYRVLGHSSADDPSRYRDEREVEEWRRGDPILRFSRFLLDRGMLEPDSLEGMERELFAEIDDAIHAQERTPSPAPETLVEDIYAEVPPHLRRQYREYRGADRA